MDTPPVFLRVDGQVQGPFAAGQLRELAAARAISAATEAAAQPAGPWDPLGALELGTYLFPTLGPADGAARSFAVANDATQPPIRLEDLIAAAQPTRRGPAAPPRAAGSVSAPHDVAALLALNRAVERRHGLEELAPRPPRRSKRRRDYLLIVGTTGIAIAAILVGESIVAVAVMTTAAQMPDQFWPVLRSVLFESPILGWGLAMLCAIASMVGWLMFGVMEDY